MCKNKQEWIVIFKFKETLQEGIIWGFVQWIWHEEQHSCNTLRMEYHQQDEFILKIVSRVP